MFTVETVSGDEVLRAETIRAATVWARNALEDDPEVGTLLIWEEGVQRRTVTFGPNADWQSVVVVLEPGEQVQPPSEYAVAIREDGSLRMEPDEDPPDLWERAADAYKWQREGEIMDDAYDPADPKHPTYHDRMAAIWDERADK